MVCLRRATPDDLPSIRQLFYDTVRTVKAADYTDAQRSRGLHTGRWFNRIDAQCFLVAVAGELERIVGTGSLTVAGYLDSLFVHKDYQRQGVTRQLMDALERVARALYLPAVTSDVSMTARSFFEQQGFNSVVEQQTSVDGVTMPNVRMVKELATALPSPLSRIGSMPFFTGSVCSSIRIVFDLVVSLLDCLSRKNEESPNR